MGPVWITTKYHVEWRYEPRGAKLKQLLRNVLNYTIKKTPAYACGGSFYFPIEKNLTILFNNQPADDMQPLTSNGQHIQPSRFSYFERVG